MEGVFLGITRDEQKFIRVVGLMEANFMYFVKGGTYLIWGQILF